MKKIILILFLAILTAVAAFALLTTRETEPSQLDKLKVRYNKKNIASVDHSKFDILKVRFQSPQQVTAACISCHNGRAGEVMKSNHWNWEREEYVKGRGIIYLGKKNAINNFCIGTEGNEQSCAKCHIGYGLKNDSLSLADENNIDCLVCHDNTETYSKAPEKGGAPDPTLDLSNIAQHVGEPKRSNCGVCHFFGGGGNNVKHGDLEKAMFEPSKDVDVHMAVDGINMQCIDCHVTEKHNISGKLYSLSSMNRNRATCEQCHTENPHNDAVLNNHTLKVACQTCHIPQYAKVNATKLDWDWSTAGQLRNGEPYEVDDADGNHTYLSIKGSFKWGKNLKPDYTWFNGTASHYLLGDAVNDTSKELVLNPFEGSYKDEDSKDYTFKDPQGKEPFDPVTKMLIQPKLFAENKGEGALWKDFDWYRASEIGMKDVNLPFSGNLSFIKTSMNWNLNHMVSSKEKTVSCTECHTQDHSRLENLKDFYMPARDKNTLIETAGMGLWILTLIGVLLHGIIRIILKKKSKKESIA